jgi:hypothetical protein
MEWLNAAKDMNLSAADPTLSRSEITIVKSDAKENFTKQDFEHALTKASRRSQPTVERKKG